MPAEWAPHERTIMGWPCRDELWGDQLGQAKADYAATANAVAAFEPLTMVCADAQDAAEARAALAGEVEVVELPIDDSWLRDSGPIFVVDDEGRRAGVHFGFNSWGEKFTPYDKDAAFGARVLEHLGAERVDAGDLILEGGSIAVDGEGTLITTEQCLLHPTRNPHLGREEIEARLREALGVEQVVWLGLGLLEDADTDGHVDNICAFARPGTVVVQGTADASNPNLEHMRENIRRLRETPDAKGRTLEVIEVDALPYADLEGPPAPVPYLNFYVVNGGVVVPVAGRPEDEAALARIAEAFPGREVVGAPGEVLAHGGGGVHCITQQMPRVA